MQDAPGALRGDGAERGQAHAGRDAFEQAAAEAALEPGDVAGALHAAHAGDGPAAHREALVERAVAVAQGVAEGDCRVGHWCAHL